MKYKATPHDHQQARHTEDQNAFFIYNIALSNCGLIVNDSVGP